MLLNKPAPVLLIEPTFPRHTAARLGGPQLAGITVHVLRAEKNLVDAMSRHPAPVQRLRQNIEQRSEDGRSAAMLRRHA